MSKRKMKKKEEHPELEVQAAMDTMRGRYCNHIQIVCQEEEFVLEFLLRVGDKVVHVDRIMLSPLHAERFAKLLNRQLSVHRTRFPTSPLKTKGRTRKKR